MHILHGSVLQCRPWQGGVEAETVFLAGLGNRDYTFSRKGVSHTNTRFKEGVRENESFTPVGQGHPHSYSLVMPEPSCLFTWRLLTSELSCRSLLLSSP